MPRHGRCARLHRPGSGPRDPVRDGIAGLLGDLELHRSLGLLLHDHGPVGDPGIVGDVPNPKSNQIAPAQLAVDRQVEQRQIKILVGQLEPDPDVPDFPQLERGLLANQFAFVPGYPLGNGLYVIVHEVSSLLGQGTSSI